MHTEAPKCVLVLAEVFGFHLASSGMQTMPRMSFKILYNSATSAALVTKFYTTNTE